MNTLTPSSIQQNWLIKHQQRLTEQMRQQRLPHAILCAGANGCGKTALAHWIVSTFSCQQPVIDSNNIGQACGQCKRCMLINSKTYPDLKVIDEGDATISVESLRDATHFLEMKAQIGANKAVLLLSAESMSVAASNALLKTLEEPTLGNLLVLTTSNLEHLLPTIISRCQLIEIRPNIQMLTQCSDPYANVSYLPEINEPQLQQSYQTFANNLLNAMLNKLAWQEFEQNFIAEERSLVWLERVVSLLIRGYHGADIAQSLNSELVQQVNAKVNIDSLNQIFQLILATNSQLKEMPQSNTALAKQQLAISLFNYFSSLESIHG